MSRSKSILVWPGVVALALCAGAAHTTSAAPARVSSLAQLEAAIAQAGPGDTITLADGSYAGAISVGRAGTAAARITIVAENLGGAVVSGGTFRLTSGAAYVTVRGLRFNGVQLVMDLGSRNCIVTRNHFEVGGAAHAVHVQGNDQELSFNNFQNKSSAGGMVQLDASGRDHAGTQRTFIHHNLFLDHNFTGSNGGECIATWGQVTRVEHNLFENCNGDPEIITVKASDGFYRFNTFRGSTRGQFVLRYARNVVVEGNYLFNTRGMRLYGPDHKITNNYLENNNGTAMMISHGAEGYLQIQRMLIAHNTIVGDGVTGRAGTLPPQGVTFVNNIIQRSAGAALTEGAGWTDTTYAGNIVSGGATTGDLTGARQVDARLVRDGDGVLRLAAGSPAVDSAVGNHGVGEDIDGHPRAGMADVGADELSTAPVLRRPLTRNDVGPRAGETPPPRPPGDGGAPPDSDGGTPPVDTAGSGSDGGGGNGAQDVGGASGEGGGGGVATGGSGAGAGGAGGGSGGSPGRGGAAGGPGSGGAGAAPAASSEPGAAGCNCHLGGRGAGSQVESALALAALAGAVIRRARRRRV
jgi:hypothetical protein